MVVGLVIPTGYSQSRRHQHLHDAGHAVPGVATNTPLTIPQELGILVIAMITSKGDRRRLRHARRDARNRAGHLVQSIAILLGTTSS